LPERVPGQLVAAQTYNDAWRGWPVLPLHRPHPIRGSFLDPRPDPELGAVYHDGVDIAVRDDRPEPGAPGGRTHKVYAIEGGRVLAATPPGVRGLVDVGHFRYEHVDALVARGAMVQPGQLIGWTWRDTWHVHLGEFVFLGDGSRIVVNALRPGGKLHPYVDSAPPVIDEIRYYAPATPSWGRRPANVARLPQAGRRLDKRRLAGVVDVRARVHDPQSFIGWFSKLPWLAAPHHPFRLRITVTHVATGRVVHDRDVFRAEQMLQLPGRSALRARNRTEPAGERLHVTPSDDPLRRHLLVPTLPAPLLGHETAPKRPLPTLHPCLGHSGEHHQSRDRGHDPKLELTDPRNELRVVGHLPRAHLLHSCSGACCAPVRATHLSLDGVTRCVRVVPRRSRLF
jgi:hypothetical protein